jgi:AcrR family transcriptional regulator
MVQVLKESVRRDILSAAKEEFLKAGYSQTSMTKIAAKAKITPANIYRYFPNKDALFEELISPVLQRWQFLFEHMERNVMPQAYLLGVNVKKYDDALLAQEIAFVNANHDALYLLFFCVSGSKYEKYVEQLVDKIAGANYQLMQAVRKTDSRLCEVPLVLMHVFAAMKVELYKEIVRNKLSKEDIESLFELLTVTTQKGWQGLIENSPNC